MTDAKETGPAVQPRLLWKHPGFLSILGFVIFAILWSSGHKSVLTAVQKTDQGIAQTIAGVTPSALVDAFRARASQCDYHWGFICEAPPVRRLCNPFGDSDLGTCLSQNDQAAANHSWLDPDRYRYQGYAGEPGILQMLLDRALMLTQAPDTAWYVLATRWQLGAIPFGLALVFVLLNIFTALVLSRGNPFFLLFFLPIVTFVASGFFWLLQSLLWLAATGFGVFVQGLLVSAAIPNTLVLCSGWIVSGKGRQVAKEAHEAKNFVRELGTNLRRRG